MNRGIGLLLMLSACAKSGGGSDSDSVSRPCSTPAGTKSVTVSWTANRESAVNRSGGGYRVYYCDYSGFSLENASYEQVDYESGASAPTTHTLKKRASGTLYIKVVAFSSLSAPGSTAASMSDASTETSVVVP